MLQLRCSGIYFRRNRTETRKRGKSHHNRSYLRPTSEHHPKGSSPYEGNHRPGTVISRRKQLSHLHHGGISPRRHLPTEASPHGGIFSEGLSPTIQGRSSHAGVRPRHLPTEASPHGGKTHPSPSPSPIPKTENLTIDLKTCDPNGTEASQYDMNSSNRRMTKPLSSERQGMQSNRSDRTTWTIYDFKRIPPCVGEPPNTLFALFG